MPLLHSLRRDTNYFDHFMNKCFILFLSLLLKLSHYFLDHKSYGYSNLIVSNLVFNEMGNIFCYVKEVRFIIFWSIIIRYIENELKEEQKTDEMKFSMRDSAHFPNYPAMLLHVL